MLPSPETNNETREALYSRVGIIPRGAVVQRIEYVDMSNIRHPLSERDAWRRMGSESFYAVEKVTFLQGGKQGERFIAQKANISIGSDPELRAKEEAERLRTLQNAGVPVPKIYMVYKGTIYRDFIPQDDMRTVRDILSRSHLRQEETAAAQEWAKQLSHIAYTVDNLGFTPLSFLGDMVHDPTADQFWYIDGGFDLGSASRRAAGNAYSALAGHFRNPSLRSILDTVYRK
jgi:hypothetical protein